MKGLKCPVCFMGRIEEIKRGHCKCPKCGEEYIDKKEIKKSLDKMISTYTFKDRAKKLFNRLKNL